MVWAIKERRETEKMLNVLPFGSSVEIAHGRYKVHKYKSITGDAIYDLFIDIDGRWSPLSTYAAPSLIIGYLSTRVCAKTEKPQRLPPK